MVEGRVPVQLLCTKTAQFGPGNRIIEIREQTPRDEAVLHAIGRCDIIQGQRDMALEQCKTDAADEQRKREQREEVDDVAVGPNPSPNAHRPSIATANAKVSIAVYGERIYKASYKTRGTLEGKSNRARKM